MIIGCGCALRGFSAFIYVLVLLAFALIGAVLSYTQSVSLFDAAEWKAESLIANCTIISRTEKACSGRQPNTGFVYDVSVIRCPRLLQDWSCRFTKNINESYPCYVSRDCESFKWNNNVPYSSIIIILISVFLTLLITLAIIDVLIKAFKENRRPEEAAGDHPSSDVNESTNLVIQNKCEIKIEN